MLLVVVVFIFVILVALFMLLLSSSSGHFLIRAPHKVEILMNDVSFHNINISTCKIKHTPIPNFHKRVCLMNFFNLSFVALLVSFAKTQKVDKFFYKMYFTEPFFIVRLTFNSF